MQSKRLELFDPFFLQRANCYNSKLFSEAHISYSSSSFLAPFLPQKCDNFSIFFRVLRLWKAETRFALVLHWKVFNHLEEGAWTWSEQLSCLLFSVILIPYLQKSNNLGKNACSKYIFHPLFFHHRSSIEFQIELSRWGWSPRKANVFLDFSSFCLCCVYIYTKSQ